MKDLKEELDPICERRNSITDEFALQVLKRGNFLVKGVAEKQLSLIKEQMFK